MMRFGRALLVVGVLALTGSFAACAVPPREAGMDTVPIALQGDGPFKRFVVKYREDSPPGAQSQAVQARLDGTAASIPAAPAVRLTWQRRMGIGADVFVADRALDREEALALMQRFSADPDVEFIEVDAMMGIDPIRP